jgi:hypothetical protein
MGLFSRGSGASKGGKRAAIKSARTETLDHLEAFIASHHECEAYVEPPTQVTETTMVIVADTGEWTRRKFPDEATAMRAAKHFKVPAYNVNLSGYPSRMREWNERQRKSLG